jgi:hypothetical protein
MNYCIWDIEGLGTAEKNRNIEYFGLTGNVTSYEIVCGNIHADDKNRIFQIDFDKYPQTKNRMRTFHVQVVK